MNEKIVAIKCSGAVSVKLQDLEAFQGNLKTLSDANYRKLKATIIELGFSEPISIWQSKGHNYILNGHQRVKALQTMVSADGFICPELPCSVVQADSIKEAKKKVLSLTSQYGKMDETGLYDFMIDAEILPQDIGNFDFSEVVIDSFIDTHFGFDPVPDTLDDREEIDERESESESEDHDEEDEPALREKAQEVCKPGDVHTIGRIKLHQGDCLEVLKTLDSESVDSLVTDPPAGIAFMGKSWDEDKGGSKEWIAWLSSVMSEAMRVMKPGAHGLVWSLPRTSHWTATALETAGFEIRDCVSHLFGSGFPKSHDVSKAIDREAGAEREKIKTPMGPTGNKYASGLGDSRPWMTEAAEKGFHEHASNEPATAAAAAWQGFGTAIKPAHEIWWLVRKPLSENTVAANVLKYGTGALNIDGSRIGTDDTRSATGKRPNDDWGMDAGHMAGSASGRFPANLVFSHHEECVEVGKRDVRASRKNADQNEIKTNVETKFGQVTSNKITTNYGNGDGTETVAAFNCHPDCAVRMLDEQSGVLKSTIFDNRGTAGTTFGGNKQIPGIVGGYSDTGGASRFFYTAKASRSDKGDFNGHPTVKSQKLMTYLIKLITPPKGIVLDPFNGSGSTGVAAQSLGMGYVGIERELEYCDISLARFAKS